MNSELIVQNLRYKNILKDINFNLKEGTINALIGRSGSGKTLLFKSIFGLINIEGSIIIGKNLETKENIKKVREKIGVYLGLNNLENKTAFLNIIEPLYNLNYDDYIARKKVYEISKKLGIESLLHKELPTLSHSQKKIIAFAQSIIHEPSVILIDDLFDSLDIYYKNRVITYLRQLKKNKKCIIIFTTNNSEDLWLVDNLMIIKNGKILANDKVKKLIEDEGLFLKNDIKLPFLIDLSYKLKAYDLIDKLIYNTNDMVDEIWK